MGLTGWLEARAARRPHVLVVETPGWWHARLQLEAELGRWGGHVAASPAAADALVVVGAPGEQLTAAVERLWQQLPGPRARAQVTAPAAAPQVVDELVAQLADAPAQARDARDREGFQPGEGDHMAPSGIPLASGADDRDGLEMDVLHVPLGPVLPHWPAGLVVRCTLSGDLVTEVDVDHVAASEPAPPLPTTSELQAARYLDSALSVLSLAGSDEQRVTTRRLRDRLVLGEETVAAQDIQRLHTVLRRSRTLRWMLKDVGRHQGTDVHDRLLATVEAARAQLEARDVPAPRLEPEELAELLPGVDLAQARLVVASLDLRLETVAARGSHA
ncbi:MAG: hypothetical protein ACTHN8_17700 [Angustibacter sp.]